MGSGVEGVISDFRLLFPTPHSPFPSHLSNILSNFQSPTLTPHTLPKKSPLSADFPVLIID
jgi:hypothetical protein